MGSYQCGLRKDRSAVEQIFSLRQKMKELHNSILQQLFTACKFLEIFLKLKAIYCSYLGTFPILSVMQ
jgi:hypothetical protein